MFESGKEYEHGGLSPQECITPVLTVSQSPGDATGIITITDIRWKRQRCTIQLSSAIPPDAGLEIDIRTRPGDPATSLASTPKAVEADGQTSLLIEDEDLVGNPAFIVIVDADNIIRAQKSTVIGG